VSLIRRNDNLGVQRDITRTNNDILRAAKSDLFLPGRNKTNFLEQVVENNETLQTMQKQEIERRVEEAEKKDDGLLQKTWNEFTSGHFVKDIWGATKTVTSSIGDTIEAVSQTPKYLMWLGIIIVVIMLIRGK